MLKVRLMGTKNDIKWFGKILQRNPKIEVTEFSDFCVDNKTPSGKRDYLVLLLAAGLGIRCGDICRLQIGDIDWNRRQISFVQSKTGDSVTMSIQREQSYEDAQMDVVSGGTIDLEMLEYYPEITGNQKALAVISELMEKLPEMEVHGSLG